MIAQLLDQLAAGAADLYIRAASLLLPLLLAVVLYRVAMIGRPRG